jgi:hypothetical protein
MLGERCPSPVLAQHSFNYTLDAKRSYRFDPEFPYVKQNRIKSSLLETRRLLLSDAPSCTAA